MLQTPTLCVCAWTAHLGAWEQVEYLMCGVNKDVIKDLGE